MDMFAVEDLDFPPPAHVMRDAQAAANWFAADLAVPAPRVRWFFLSGSRAQNKPTYELDAPLAGFYIRGERAVWLHSVSFINHVEPGAGLNLRMLKVIAHEVKHYQRSLVETRAGKALTAWDDEAVATEYQLTAAMRYRATLPAAPRARRQAVAPARPAAAWRWNGAEQRYERQPDVELSQPGALALLGYDVSKYA